MGVSIGNSNKYLPYALLTVVSVSVFTFITFNISTDIQAHAAQALSIKSGVADYPPNLFYYWLLNVLSLGAETINVYYILSIGLLTLAVLVKYHVTLKIFSNYFSKLTTVKGFHAALLSLSLCVFFSLPDIYNYHYLGYYYLGRITPNVWHNSTTIFVMPFALLLFWEQYKVIVSERLSSWRLVLISSLVLLNLLIKPSFLFVFIPITCLFLVQKFNSDIRRLFLSLIPALVGVLGVFLQYVAIYELEYGSFHQSDSSVSISLIPFSGLSQYLPNWYIPVSILISYLFPLTFLVFYPEQLKSRLVRFSLWLVFLALLISAFVTEEGPRKGHLNFFWQSIIATYILMLVTTLKYYSLRLASGSRLSLKLKLLEVLWILHIISGVFYFLRLLVYEIYK
ncbi:hypothetical protein [Halocola ammonii]